MIINLTGAPGAGKSYSLNSAKAKGTFKALINHNPISKGFRIKSFFVCMLISPTKVLRLFLIIFNSTRNAIRTIKSVSLICACKRLQSKKAKSDTHLFFEEGAIHYLALSIIGGNEINSHELEPIIEWISEDRITLLHLKTPADLRVERCKHRVSKGRFNNRQTENVAILKEDRNYDLIILAFKKIYPDKIKTFYSQSELENQMAKIIDNLHKYDSAILLIPE